MAWAHGTVEIGDSCTPSARSLNPGFPEETVFLNTLLDDGYAIVARDYAGAGTPGTQKYLNASSQGRNVIDSVRAASQLDLPLSDAWSVVGFPKVAVPHWAPFPWRGSEWRQMWDGFVDSFPDERWEVQSVVDCGDVVTVRVIDRGTFLNPWVFPDAHIAEPTGRAYVADSVVVFSLDAERKIDSYLQFTTPGFSQVGVTPETAAAVLRNGF